MIDALRYGCLDCNAGTINREKYFRLDMTISALINKLSSLIWKKIVFV